jgi:hypothetical protein|tara:strand:- start:39252 stop:39611 length:360 start_codon:yes stop_codon:yes gene_type:complete
MTKVSSYQEMIDAGYYMTGEGIWMPPDDSQQTDTRGVEYSPDNEYIDKVVIEELMKPTDQQTQFAWSQQIFDDSTDLQIDEYEKLIELVFNEIKKEYKDDETCRTNSLLLGKLLCLANQ